MTDPSQINNSLNQQLPTNNSGKITAAVLRGALTTGVAGSLGLTAWIAATFAPVSTTLSHAATNSALQAIVPTAGQVYVRDGFYAAGDGGQATYTGSLTNCLTPDNGAQVQPSGTGCWQQSTNFDFKVFGAYGDGVHNDTTAIQNDINAAEARINRTDYWGASNVPSVHCPAGQYYESGVTLTYASLLGDAPQQCKFVLAAGANKSAIVVAPIPQSDPTPWAGYQQITLRGFSIDGNASNQTGTSHGIEFKDASYNLATRYGTSARVVDVNVLATLNDGIYVGNNRNFGMLDRVIVNYAQNDCVYFNGATDWEIGSGSSLGACTFNGVDIYFSSAITIVGSAIYNNGSDGIKVEDGFGSYLLITGTTIGANGGNGINITPSSQITAGFIGLSNVHLTDNSLGANNSWSQIFVKNFSNLSLDNVWFLYVGTGNNAKYLINNDSNGYVNVSNLHYVSSGGSTPYTTAAYATPAKIVGATNPDSGLWNLNVPYSANGSQGLSCSGTPTASFASVNGIVTHC